MVALEDNLLALLFVFAVLVAIAAMGVALWKPVLRRAWRYLLLWWERDKIAEAEATRLKDCREKAEAEIAGEAVTAVAPPATTTPVCAATPPSEPVLQKVQR